MNLRELLDAIAAIHIAHGGDMPVLSVDGQDVHSLEFNEDEEPCVLILFQEDISG